MAKYKHPCSQTRDIQSTVLKCDEDFRVYLTPSWPWQLDYCPSYGRTSAPQRGRPMLLGQEGQCSSDRKTSAPQTVGPILGIFHKLTIKYYDQPCGADTMVPAYLKEGTKAGVDEQFMWCDHTMKGGKYSLCVVDLNKVSHFKNSTLHPIAFTPICTLRICHPLY